jgi:hypothetical protein
MVLEYARPATWELSAKTVFVVVTGQSLPPMFKALHRLATGGIYC